MQRIHLLIAGLAVALMASLAAPAAPAAAHNGDGCSLSGINNHPTWGCARVNNVNHANGAIDITIDDIYVSASWPTPQSNVSECTYVQAVDRNGNVYGDRYWRDCGGDARRLYLDVNFATSSWRIASKDSHGRWRYQTVAVA